MGFKAGFTKTGLLTLHHFTNRRDVTKPPLLNTGFEAGLPTESTTFERATNERATKESRNMSAATKERHDKRAPRQKSAATK
jgi:hypothetical protein